MRLRLSIPALVLALGLFAAVTKADGAHTTVQAAGLAPAVQTPVIPSADERKLVDSAARKAADEQAWTAGVAAGEAQAAAEAEAAQQAAAEQAAATPTSGTATAALSSPDEGGDDSYQPAPSGSGDAYAAVQEFFGDVFVEAWGADDGSPYGVTRCESGHDPGAISPGGGNWGLFQINTVHKADFEQYTGQPWSAVLNAHYNAMYARKLYDGKGWGPWSCRWAAYS